MSRGDVGISDIGIGQEFGMVAISNRSIRMCFAIAGMVVITSSALGQDEEKPPTLLRRIGQAVGQMLSGEHLQRINMVQEQAFEAPLAPAMVAGPQGQPSEKDREIFKTRTEGYTNAFRRWLIEVCELTAEQQTQFDEGVKAELEAIQTAYAKETDVNRQHAAMGDTYPLIFPIKGERTVKIDRALKKFLDANILTDVQKQKLDAAIKERSEWQAEQFRTLILQLLDSQLYFSGEQRAQLNDTLKVTGKIKHPLYTFQPQSYYLPYESIETLVPSAFRSGNLEKPQQQRLKDLGGANDNSNMIFQSNEGPEGWERTIKDASERYRKMLILAAEVRIAWYRRELSLSEADVAKLQIAAKGATISEITTWKEQAQNTIDQMVQQMARFGGNFAFGTQTLSAQSLDSSDIWQQAIEKIAGANVVEARTANERNIMAGEVAALLDQELWILPSERQKVIDAIAPTMPAKFSSIQYSEYFRDMVLICHPLCKLSEEQKKATFSEPQVAVFDLLAKHFRYKAENGYAEFSLRNQGTFHLTLSR